LECDAHNGDCCKIYITSRKLGWLSDVEDSLKYLSGERERESLTGHLRLARPDFSLQEEKGSFLGW